ncbi:PQQ-binding-like beta-propeller repeat protein [Streptomyces sp. NPDC087270]|uniref:outer membrane protein assembly factor BamB family protein n=1 Tax=Streptomyces sp. NPDC087270 TaxID=3365774 RepID=UPI00380D4E44
MSRRTLMGAGAAAAAALTLDISPALSGSAAADSGATATVSGVVYLDRRKNGTAGHGNPGIAGVAVSDGVRTVLTDRDGAYHLSVDPGRRAQTIVFVCVPDGYTAPLDQYRVPRFYRRVGALSGGSQVTADFGLDRDHAAGGSAFTFTQISDTHVNTIDIPEPPSDDKGAAIGRISRYLEQIGALTAAPAFILNTGDLSFDGADGMFQGLLAALKNSPLPVWPVVGNHDHGGGGSLGTDRYRSYLGPEWYSFDYRGCHFVVLENNGGFGVAEQLAWLQQDLKLHARDAKGRMKKLIVATHEPWDTPAAGGSAVQLQAYLDALAPYGPRTLLNGHSHANYVSERIAPNTVQYNTSSSNYNDDQSPMGYREFAVTSKGVRSTFRPYDYERRTAFLNPLPGQTVARTRTDFQVNVFDTSAEIEWVRFRVDDRGGWNDLKRTGLFTWSAPWNTRQLGLGRHTARLRVHARGNTAWSAETTFTVTAAPAAVPAVANRPELQQFHGGPAHTGIAAGRVGPELDLLWSHRSGAATVMSSPVIASGVAYWGTWDNDAEAGNGLIAVDTATGGQLWRFPTRSQIQGTPAVSADTVYATEVYGLLHAVDARTGKQRWSLMLPGVNATLGGWAYTSPTVVDTTVYAIGYGSTPQCSAIDALSGRVLWSAPLDGGWWNSTAPTVVGDKVYINSNPSELVILDRATGTRLAASSQLGALTHSTPAVDGDTAYAGAFGNILVARDATTAAEKWRFTSTGPSVHEAAQMGSSPAVDGNTVYVGFTDGRVTAVDKATGGQKWSVMTGAAIVSSPTVAGDLVWIGSMDGFLYAFDRATGAKRAAVDIGAPVDGTPAVADHLLLVTAYDGNLYALTTRR